MPVNTHDARRFPECLEHAYKQASNCKEVILQRSCMCGVHYLKHSSESVCAEDKSRVLFGQAATSRCELAACELAVLVVDRLA